MAENMWAMFSSLGADPDDVFVALRIACGTSESMSGRMAVLGSPAELEVGYSRKGKPIVRAAQDASPDWTSLVVRSRESLASELRWATTVVSGRFRTMGALATPTLQLRPVDELHAAEPAHARLPSLNALLVDVAYEHPADPFLQGKRRVAQLSEAANLLSVATWPPVWQPKGREDWTVLEPPTVPTIQNARTRPGFWVAAAEAEALSPPAVTAYPELELIPHERFVAGPYDLLSTGVQYAVETLPILHQKLVSMQPHQRRKANRALAWMADGARANAPGVKIACAVAGLEALLSELPSERCELCKQERYHLTKRIEDFLDEFAGTAMRKEFRDEIYAFRSGLVHGLKHYAVDEPFLGIFGEGDIDALKATGAAHAAAINWLLNQ